MANLAKGKHVVSYLPGPSVKKACAQQAWIQKWRKPQPGWMKLNVDGSFDPNYENGGTGTILRDERGTVIFSSCRFFGRCSDAREMELLAYKEGIALAIQWTLKPIVVESDCLEAVRMLQYAEKDLSTLAYIIREINALMSRNREIVIQKSPVVKIVSTCSK